MSNGLETWITEQLERRGWSIREAARRGGISHTAIVNAMSDTANTELKTYRALASVFGASLQTVLQIAGEIPTGEKPPELKHAMDQLEVLHAANDQYFDAVVTTIQVLLASPKLREPMEEQRTIPPPPPRPMTELDDIRDQLRHIQHTLDAYPARFTVDLADLLVRRMAERDARQKRDENENHTEGEKAEGGHDQTLGD